MEILFERAGRAALRAALRAARGCRDRVEVGQLLARHLFEGRLVEDAAHEGGEHARALDGGVEAGPGEGEVALTRAAVACSAGVPPLALARHAHALWYVELLEGGDEACGGPAHRRHEEAPRHLLRVGVGVEVGVGLGLGLGVRRRPGTELR